MGKESAASGPQTLTSWLLSARRSCLEAVVMHARVAQSRSSVFYYWTHLSTTPPGGKLHARPCSMLIYRT